MFALAMALAATSCTPLSNGIAAGLCLGGVLDSNDDYTFLALEPGPPPPPLPEAQAQIVAQVIAAHDRQEPLPPAVIAPGAELADCTYAGPSCAPRAPLSRIAARVGDKPTPAAMLPDGRIRLLWENSGHYTRMMLIRITAGKIAEVAVLPPTVPVKHQTSPLPGQPATEAAAPAP